MPIVCLLRQAHARTIIMIFCLPAFFNADDLETTLFFSFCRWSVYLTINGIKQHHSIFLLLASNRREYDCFV